MVAMIKVVYKLRVHGIWNKHEFYEKETHKNVETEKDNKKEGEREREREREREKVQFRLKYIENQGK